MLPNKPSGLLGLPNEALGFESSPNKLVRDAGPGLAKGLSASSNKLIRFAFARLLASFGALSTGWGAKSGWSLNITCFPAAFGLFASSLSGAFGKD
jgi:hypothetical protein